MPVTRLELFDIAGENGRQVLGGKVCSFGIDYILLVDGNSQIILLLIHAIQTLAPR